MIRQWSKDLKHLIPGKRATKVYQNYKVSIYIKKKIVLMLEKWVTYVKRYPVVRPTIKKSPAAIFPMINRVDI